jgi:uncharacterized protein DUF3465
MKNFVLFILVGGLIYWGFKELNTPNATFSSTKQKTTSSDAILKSAYKNKKHDLQVQGSGVVIKILSDDLKGSRHQRFIIKLGNGQTLLVAHNIDLAPRVATLKKGDRIAFYGEYEWNSKGGVIHWTHHDPKRRHIAGWLKCNGKKYQ